MTEHPLSDLIGRVVDRVRRIWYAGPQGEVATDEGPVELTFRDGTCVLLVGGGDGYTLKVEAGPWLDPFSPPLSEENREFVRLSGKWTAFDLTDVPPYAALVGSTIVAARRLPADSRSTGAELVTDSGTLAVRVDSDETIVRIYR